MLAPALLCLALCTEAGIRSSIQDQQTAGQSPENTADRDSPTVAVGTRTYAGRYTAVSREFLGIEYAQPPTGALRWFPAQPLLPLSSGPTTIDVGSKFGPMCNQDWQFSPNAGGMPLGPNPDGSPQTFGESCLVLNVYTPRNATASSKLPVLVFGHGGGDANGASSMGRPLLLNGSNAVQAAPHISVTINYRLAAMGYLAHPAFASEPNGSVGNFGLTDHLQALRWVKAHILRFGGDPTRILFFGQSSGANHALWIPLMAPFRGLVRAVASHSACAQPFFNPDCGASQSKNVSETTALAYAKKNGCASGDDATVRTCLRAIPAAELAKGPSPFSGPKPYYGSELLPDLPYEMYQRGEFDHTVKIMAGHNSGESVEMPDITTGRSRSTTHWRRSGGPSPTIRWQSQRSCWRKRGSTTCLLEETAAMRAPRPVTLRPAQRSLAAAGCTRTSGKTSTCSAARMFFSTLSAPELRRLACHRRRSTAGALMQSSNAHLRPGGRSGSTAASIRWIYPGCSGRSVASGLG